MGINPARITASIRGRHWCRAMTPLHYTDTRGHETWVWYQPKPLASQEGAYLFAAWALVAWPRRERIRS